MQDFWLFRNKQILQNFQTNYFLNNDRQVSGSSYSNKLQLFISSCLQKSNTLVLLDSMNNWLHTDNCHLRGHISEKCFSDSI